MSNAKSPGAGPFTADGNIPGAPAQPVTDLVTNPVSAGSRTRPTDYIANPVMPGSIAAGARSATSSKSGAGPADMAGPDHDVSRGRTDHRGKGIEDSFDPALAESAPSGSTAVPFANLHSEKGAK